MMVQVSDIRGAPHMRASLRFLMHFSAVVYLLAKNRDVEMLDEKFLSLRSTLWIWASNTSKIAGCSSNNRTSLIHLVLI